MEAWSDRTSQASRSSHGYLLPAEDKTFICRTVTIIIRTIADFRCRSDDLRAGEPAGSGTGDSVACKYSPASSGCVGATTGARGPDTRNIESDSIAIVVDGVTGFRRGGAG